MEAEKRVAKNGKQGAWKRQREMWRGVWGSKKGTETKMEKGRKPEKQWKKSEVAISFSQVCLGYDRLFLCRQCHAAYLRRLPAGTYEEVWGKDGVRGEGNIYDGLGEFAFICVPSNFACQLSQYTESLRCGEDRLMHLARRWCPKILFPTRYIVFD